MRRIHWAWQKSIREPLVCLHDALDCVYWQKDSLKRAVRHIWPLPALLWVFGWKFWPSLYRFGGFNGSSPSFLMWIINELSITAFVPFTCTNNKCEIVSDFLIMKVAWNVCEALRVYNETIKHELSVSVNAFQCRESVIVIGSWRSNFITGTF